MNRLHGWDLAGFPRACFVASIVLALGGCGATNVISTAGLTSGDAMDPVRNADFSARFPVANEGNPGNPGKTAKPSESSQSFLFPGSDVTPERRRDRDPEMRTASLQQAAFVKGDGVEMNFEGAGTAADISNEAEVNRP